MNDSALKALAAYFGGPTTACHSMGLSLGGDRKMAADAFFAARKAVGVWGWSDPTAAERLIRQTLSK